MSETVGKVINLRPPRAKNIRSIVEWCKSEGFSEQLGNLEIKYDWSLNDLYDLADKVDMKLPDLMEVAMRKYCGKEELEFTDWFDRDPQMAGQ